MATKDYYKVLGVAKDANQDVIKRAYRKLARKLHPDVNPDDAAAENRFKEISEAYHVLGDAERRRNYDAAGPEAFAREHDMSDFTQHFHDVFAGRRGGGGFGLFEDLLGGSFGSAGGPRPRAEVPRRGQDAEASVRLSLTEAALGTERQLNLQGQEGRRRVRVKIPRGARPGARIRVAGKGAPGHRGGPAGDLFLTVAVDRDARFRLDGINLRADLPLSIYEAARGATVSVETLEGVSRIRVPAGTQSGQVFRLREQGFPRAPGASARGDLLATAKILLPEPLPAGFGEAMDDLEERFPYRLRSVTVDAP